MTCLEILFALLVVWCYLEVPHWRLTIMILSACFRAQRLVHAKITLASAFLSGCYKNPRFHWLIVKEYATLIAEDMAESIVRKYATQRQEKSERAESPDSTHEEES